MLQGNCVLARCLIIWTALYEFTEKEEETAPCERIPSLVLGMIGPDRTSDALVVSRFISSLPANQRLVQISGSATGKQLSDKTLYPNFFRVIPPDDTQVEVSKLSWLRVWSPQ